MTEKTQGNSVNSQTLNTKGPQHFFLKTNFSNSSSLFQPSKNTKSIPNIIVSSFQTNQSSVEEYLIKNPSQTNVLSSNKITTPKRNLHKVSREKNEKLDPKKRLNTSKKSVIRDIFAEKEGMSNIRFSPLLFFKKNKNNFLGLRQKKNSEIFHT